MQAQGALGIVKAQMMRASGAAAATVKSKVVYMSDCSLGRTQSSETSKVKRGGTRHPTRSIAGTIDVAGSIPTELQATCFQLAAACGSVSITGSSVTVGADLSSGMTFTYDWINQELTINKTAHGAVVGDTLEIVATAPSIMNGTFYYPVIDRPTADQCVVWVPMGGSGTVTVTSVKICTAGTFTYTYKAGGKLPLYRIEKGFPDVGNYYLYDKCVCSTMNISGIGASGPVSMDTEWMGCSETPGTSSFDTGTSIDNTKISFDNSQLAAADVKEGGSAVTFVKSQSFKLDNKLDGDTFVAGGNGVRPSINTGEYEITGAMQAVYESLTLYNKALNRTESNLDDTFKHGTGAGTAGNESLQIVAPELLFTAKSPVMGSTGVYLDTDFVADYTDNADATAFKIIVKCTQLPGQVI